MANIEDTGGSKRLKGLFAKLRTELPAKVFQIGSEMASEASLRAPSPQDEYNIMMQGEGNPEGLPSGGGPGQTDDGDHRLRFEKPDGLYLQQEILANFQMIDNLTVGVGNIANLNTSSQYSWTNINGDRFTSSFPFWECWEGGISGTFYIHPVNGKTEHAKLVPAPGHRFETMTKTIPALGMFRGVDLEYIVEETLIPAIRAIVREA